MPTLELPGVRLAYHLAGAQGSPVILIMGFAVPSRAWEAQIDALAQHHRVAWYDQRGSGQSRAKAGAYTMGMLAKDAVALMDHLAWERAHIVGVSMGGMVAQRIALEHVHRVLSLTLIATHAGGVRARVPTLRGALHFFNAQWGSRASRRNAIANLLFPKAFVKSAAGGWLDEVLKKDLQQSASLRFRLSQLAAVARHDTRRKLRRLAGTPTLIVQPGLDDLVRPEESERLHKLIPGSKLVVFPDAGHGILRQAAPQLNAAILRHLADVDASRASPPAPSRP
jgi:pimeloyl-ACP methyl ester carboxylesterase